MIEKKIDGEKEINIIDGIWIKQNDQGKYCFVLEGKYKKDLKKIIDMEVHSFKIAIGLIYNEISYWAGIVEENYEWLETYLFNRYKEIRELIETKYCDLDILATMSFDKFLLLLDEYEEKKLDKGKKTR